jgi:hypothetical protein
MWAVLCHTDKDIGPESASRCFDAEVEMIAARCHERLIRYRPIEVGSLK